jgi:signal transduction histidine kinase
VRRRLLFVIVGTVISALTVAALATFVGIRRDAVKRSQQNLTTFAENLVNSGGAKDLEILTSFKQALGLESATVWTFPRPDVNPSSPEALNGLSAALTATNPEKVPLDAGGTSAAVLTKIGPKELQLLTDGKQLTGTTGNRAYAAVRSSTDDGEVQTLVLVQDIAGNARQAVRVIILAASVALLFAALAAAVLARRMARPLVAATGAYKRIAAGDLSVRIAERGRASQRNDEIGELMRSLDVMAEALDRAQKQEQQFLLSVSHDLRTPLTSIRGFAEAISEGTAPDQQRAATVIASEARRLERLVGDLLTLARLEAHRFALNPKRVDLSDLVTDTTDGFLPEAERHGLFLDLDAEFDLWAVVDPERMAQVVANLIDNALKFASTKITVTLISEKHEATETGVADSAHLGKPGETDLILKIADDGPGISDEDLPHIFERLFSSDRLPTRKIGTGLGLAIVRELLDLMGASISTATSPTGTTFTVRMPGADPAVP